LQLEQVNLSKTLK